MKPNTLPISLAMLFLMVLPGCGRSQADALKPNPTPYYYSLPSDYYLFLPSSYTPEKEWPLFIGIHGSGSDGKQCLKWWQEDAEREGFVLLCPSLADEGGGWYAEQGISQLNQIVKQVRRDTRVGRKYFLAGFSAGAEFIQLYAMSDSDSVQGVAILSSGNYYEPSADASQVPYLLVIGDQDNATSVQTAKEFAALLKQEGFSIDFHLLPGIGHRVTPEGLELTIAFYRETANHAPER